MEAHYTDNVRGNAIAPSWFERTVGVDGGVLATLSATATRPVERIADTEELASEKTDKEQRSSPIRE
jgi:hypothetical protein